MKYDIFNSSLLNQSYRKYSSGWEQAKHTKTGSVRFSFSFGWDSFYHLDIRVLMGCMMRMFCMSVDTDEFEEQNLSKSMTFDEFDSI